MQQHVFQVGAALCLSCIVPACTALGVCLDLDCSNLGHHCKGSAYQTQNPLAALLGALQAGAAAVALIFGSFTLQVVITCMWGKHCTCTGFAAPAMAIQMRSCVHTRIPAPSICLACLTAELAAN